MKRVEMVLLTPTEINMLEEILNVDGLCNPMPINSFKDLIRQMECKIGLMMDFINPIHEEICPSEEHFGLTDTLYRVRNRLFH